MSANVLLGARVSPDVRAAFADLAKRRERTVSGELRIALAEHLRRAQAEQGKEAVGAR